MTRNVQTIAVTHTVHNIPESAESVMKVITDHIVKERVIPLVKHVLIIILVTPVKRDSMVMTVNRDALIAVRTVNVMANVRHVLLDILERGVDVN